MRTPSILKSLPAVAAHFLEPMKCRLAAELPRGDAWVYEIKFDGYRGLALKKEKKVSLISRNQKELGLSFPHIVDALGKLKAETLLLDGEIVALDDQGRSGFQLLQGAGERGLSSARIYYYVFDLLNWNGRDTTSLPLTKRKALLTELLQDAPPEIRLSGFLPGKAGDLAEKMKNLGLEGLIAKERDSTYQSGQRSGSWIKFKWGNEQEFVLGGFTRPAGSRPYFGSVIVGYYQNDKLFYAAKVGTGFNGKSLKSLYDQFQDLLVDKCPFVNLPERGTGLTAGQMKSCKWIRPELVCQVRFTEWTRDNHLRQPVFLGLRTDKAPEDVAREIPA